MPVVWRKFVRRAKCLLRLEVATTLPLLYEIRNAHL